VGPGTGCRIRIAIASPASEWALLKDSGSVL
jgi:hypothetical protein